MIRLDYTQPKPDTLSPARTGGKTFCCLLSLSLSFSLPLVVGSIYLFTACYRAEEALTIANPVEERPNILDGNEFYY